MVLLALSFMVAAYQTGKNVGCRDLVMRLNEYGFNNGAGLSSWAWCEKSKQ